MKHVFHSIYLIYKDIIPTTQFTIQLFLSSNVSMLFFIFRYEKLNVPISMQLNVNDRSGELRILIEYLQKDFFYFFNFFNSNFSVVLIVEYFVGVDVSENGRC